MTLENQQSQPSPVDINKLPAHKGTWLRGNLPSSVDSRYFSTPETHEVQLHMVEKLGTLIATYDSDGPAKETYDINDIASRIGEKFENLGDNNVRPLDANFSQIKSRLIQILKEYGFVGLNRLVSNVDHPEIKVRELSNFIVKEILLKIGSSSNPEMLAQAAASFGVSVDDIVLLQKAIALTLTIPGTIIADPKLVQTQDNLFVSPEVELVTDIFKRDPEISAKVEKINNRGPDTYRADVIEGTAFAVNQLATYAGRNGHNTLKLVAKHLLGKEYPGINEREALLRKISTQLFSARGPQDIEAFLTDFAVTPAILTEIGASWRSGPRTPRVMARSLLQMLAEDPPNLSAEMQSFYEAIGELGRLNASLGVTHPDFAAATTPNRTTSGLDSVAVPGGYSPNANAEGFSKYYAEDTLRRLAFLETLVPNGIDESTDYALASGRLNAIAWLTGDSSSMNVAANQLDLDKLREQIQPGDRESYVTNYSVQKDMLRDLAAVLSPEDYKLYARMIADANRRLDEALYTIIFYSFNNIEQDTDFARYSDIREVFWGSPDNPVAPRFQLLDSPVQIIEDHREAIDIILSSLPEEVRNIFIGMIPTLRVWRETQRQSIPDRISSLQVELNLIKLPDKIVDSSVDGAYQVLGVRGHEAAELFDPDTVLVGLRNARTRLNQSNPPNQLSFLDNRIAVRDAMTKLSVLKAFMLEASRLTPSEVFDEWQEQLVLLELQIDLLETNLSEYEALLDKDNQLSLDSVERQITEKAEAQKQEIIRFVAVGRDFRRPVLEQFQIDETDPLNIEYVPLNNPGEMRAAISVMHTRVSKFLRLAFPDQQKVAPPFGSDANRVISYFGYLSKRVEESELTNQEAIDKILTRNAADLGWAGAESIPENMRSQVLMHILLEKLRNANRVQSEMVTSYVSEILLASGYNPVEVSINPDDNIIGVSRFRQERFGLPELELSRFEKIKRGIMKVTPESIDAADTESQIRMLGELRELANNQPQSFGAWLGVEINPNTALLASREPAPQAAENYSNRRKILIQIKNNPEIVPELVSAADIDQWISRIDEEYVTFSFKLIQGYHEFKLGGKVTRDFKIDTFVNILTGPIDQAGVNLPKAQFLIDVIEQLENVNTPFESDTEAKFGLMMVFSKFPVVDYYVRSNIASHQQKLRYAESGIQQYSTRTERSNLVSRVVLENLERTSARRPIQLAELDRLSMQLKENDPAEFERSHQRLIQEIADQRKALASDSRSQWIKAAGYESEVDGFHRELQQRLDDAKAIFIEAVEIRKRRLELAVQIQEMIEKSLEQLPRNQSDYVVVLMSGSYPNIMSRISLKADQKSRNSSAPYQHISDNLSNPDSGNNAPQARIGTIRRDIETFKLSVSAIDSIESVGLAIDAGTLKEWQQNLREITLRRTIAMFRDLLPEPAKTEFNNRLYNPIVARIPTEDARQVSAILELIRVSTGDPASTLNQLYREQMDLSLRGNVRNPDSFGRIAQAIDDLLNTPEIYGLDTASVPHARKELKEFLSGIYPPLKAWAANQLLIRKRQSESRLKELKDEIQNEFEDMLYRLKEAQKLISEAKEAYATENYDLMDKKLKASEALFEGIVYADMSEQEVKDLMSQNIDARQAAVELRQQKIKDKLIEISERLGTFEQYLIAKDDWLKWQEWFEDDIEFDSKLDPSLITMDIQSQANSLSRLNEEIRNVRAAHTEKTKKVPQKQSIFRNALVRVRGGIQKEILISEQMGMKTILRQEKVAFSPDNFGRETKKLGTEPNVVNFSVIPGQEIVVKVPNSTTYVTYSYTDLHQGRLIRVPEGSDKPESESPTHQFAFRINKDNTFDFLLFEKPKAA